MAGTRPDMTVCCGRALRCVGRGVLGLRLCRASPHYGSVCAASSFRRGPLRLHHPAI
jgi:hypothetical protein